MRVRFTRDFDWDPPEHRGRTTLAFKKGQEITVRREAGEAAVTAGAAVEAKARRRNDDAANAGR